MSETPVQHINRSREIEQIVLNNVIEVNQALTMKLANELFYYQDTNYKLNKIVQQQNNTIKENIAIIAFNQISSNAEIQQLKKLQLESQNTNQTKFNNYETRIKLLSDLLSKMREEKNKLSRQNRIQEYEYYSILKQDLKKQESLKVKNQQLIQQIRQKSCEFQNVIQQKNDKINKLDLQVKNLKKDIKTIEQSINQSLPKNTDKDCIEHKNQIQKMQHKSKQKLNQNKAHIFNQELKSLYIKINNISNKLLHQTNINFKLKQDLQRKQQQNTNINFNINYIIKLMTDMCIIKNNDSVMDGQKIYPQFNQKQLRDKLNLLKIFINKESRNQSIKLKGSLSIQIQNSLDNLTGFLNNLIRQILTLIQKGQLDYDQIQKLQILKENNKKNVQSLQKQLFNEKERIKILQSKSKQNQTKLQQKQDKIAKLQIQIKTKQNQLTEKIQQLIKLTKKQSDKSIEIAKLQTELKKLKQDIERQNKNRGTTQIKLKQNYSLLDGQLKQKQSELKQKSNELVNLNQSLKRQQKAHTSTKAKLHHLQAQLQDKKKSYQAEITQIKSKSIIIPFLAQSMILDISNSKDRNGINFIRQSIQKLKGKKVMGSKTLFKKQSIFLHHQYVEDQRNLLLIVRLQNDYVIGGFSEPAVAKKSDSKGKGILFCVTNNKVYHLKPERQSPVTSDDMYFIFGNSQIRIKQQEFFCNFGIQNAFFNSNGEDFKDFIGGKTRQPKMKGYQILQVRFQDEDYTRQDWIVRTPC